MNFAPVVSIVELKDDVVSDNVIAIPKQKGKGGEQSEIINTDDDDTQSSLHGSHKIYYCSVLCGPVIAILTWLFVYRTLSEHETTTIETAHDEIARVIVSHLLSTVYLTRKDCISIAGLFAASTSVNSDEFRRFVTTLGKGKSNYYQAMGWIPQVSHDRREEYELAMQTPYRDRWREHKNNKSYPGFFLTDVNGYVRDNASLYYPVYYIEPYENNIRAHGLDVGSSDVRLAALTLSSKVKQSVASAMVRLVQEGEVQFGFLLLAPVFANDTVKGFAVGVCRIGDMVAHSISGIRQHGIEISLVDRTDNNSLLHSDNNAATHYQNVSNLPNTISDVITFATREWEVLIRRTSAFDDSRRTITPMLAAVLMAAIFGIAIIFICGLIAKTSVSRKRLEMVLKISTRTAAAIAVMDLDSVSFLHRLDEKAHPMLLAFKDIVGVLVEYRRFLPDMIQVSATPIVEKCGDIRSVSSFRSHRSASVGSEEGNRVRVATQSNLAIGVKKSKITVIRVVLNHETCTSSETLNTFSTALHAMSRQHGGRTISLVASHAQLVFMGWSTNEPCRAKRSIHTALPDLQVSFVIGQGDCLAGIAGGDLARYSIVHGSVCDELETLLKISRFLGISTLCTDKFRSNAVPMERFYFVDWLADSTPFFLLVDSIEYSENQDAEWMYHIQVGETDEDPISRASCLMQARKFTEAATSLAMCDKHIVVQHHLCRLSQNKTEPLAFLFTAVDQSQERIQQDDELRRTNSSDHDHL